MARQRRSLDEHIANLSMRSRMDATQYLSTPPLPTIGTGPDGTINIPWQSIGAGMLRDDSVTISNLSIGLRDTINSIPELEAWLSQVSDQVEVLGAVAGPGGIISRWANSDPVTAYDNTPIHSASLPVPARGVLKVTVNLRGTATVSGQYTRLYATADGVEFGEHHHYSPSSKHESNETLAFFYQNPGEAKTVTFDLFASVPDGGAFTIPTRAAGSPPQTEVIYEDIGPLPPL